MKYNNYFETILKKTQLIIDKKKIPKYVLIIVQLNMYKFMWLGDK